MPIKFEFRPISCAMMCFALLGLSLTAQAESPLPNDIKPQLEQKQKEHKAKMLQKIDTNQDGQISKDEFVGEAERKFASMDSDSDGLLSPEEMQARHKERRAQMKAKFEKMKDKGSVLPAQIDNGLSDTP